MTIIGKQINYSFRQLPVLFVMDQLLCINHVTVYPRSRTSGIVGITQNKFSDLNYRLDFSSQASVGIGKFPFFVSSPIPLKRHKKVNEDAFIKLRYLLCF